MNNFDRNIFTDNKRTLSDILIDIAFSVAIGLALAMGALAYFDVLFM